jgi:hypothetical protein
MPHVAFIKDPFAAGVRAAAQHMVGLASMLDRRVGFFFRWQLERSRFF